MSSAEAAGAAAAASACPSLRGKASQAMGDILYIATTNY